MRDVAALAGVALKTVSRVMNDVPSVDAELAARVRGAADKLGYRPNLTASNLRRRDGRTGMIGLLVEDVGNPFSAAILRAVENVARERAVLTLTGSVNEDTERETNLARALIDRRCDGLIMVPGGTDYRWLAAEMTAGTAFAFVDRAPTPLMADAVVADSRSGSARGTAHLVAHGHRRIAYLGDEPTILTAQDRYAGYLDALDQVGLAADPDLVRTGLRTADAAQAAALDLIDRHRPTAIFAAQNLVSIGVVRALHQRGLEHEIALVGFDDVVLAALIRPAITVIAQDVEQMGRLAAQRLFARLDGDTTAPQVVTVPTTLVPRGSGELTPG